MLTLIQLLYNKEYYLKSTSSTCRIYYVTAFDFIIIKFSACEYLYIHYNHTRMNINIKSHKILSLSNVYAITFTVLLLEFLYIYIYVYWRFFKSNAISSHNFTIQGSSVQSFFWHPLFRKFSKLFPRNSWICIHYYYVHLHTQKFNTTVE